MMRSRSLIRFVSRGMVVAVLAALVGALALFRAEALPPSGGSIDLDSTSADLTVYGDDSGDHSGERVAAGDINGDTVDDLIIGAAQADQAGGQNAGETYVIYGGGSLPATKNLASAPADLTVLGINANDCSGVGVAAGDIDNDGYDDLIIGANFGDGPGGGDTGETYVIYGGASLSTPWNLASTPADLTVYGEYGSSYSGAAVAAGDINGDDYDDIIIGSIHAGPLSQGGAVYVIYGSDSLSGSIDLSSTSASLTVRADDAGDNAGNSVAVGDIDGDGTDDLIIGANAADGSGSGTSCGTGQVGDRCQTGETYVIYGGTPGVDLPAVGGTIDLASDDADLTVYGDDDGDGSGKAVAAGDIDGDTTADLIIGANAADPAGGGDGGETYVIYGGPGLGTGTPPAIDLDQCPVDEDHCPDLTVYGDDYADHSGWWVAAGNIDGDAYDDLIIGVHRGDAAGGHDAGETYVIYGGDSLPTTIDLNQCCSDANQCAGLTVYGDDPDDISGLVVAAGDIDGDTTSDLIITAENADPAGGTNAGETYLIYGGARDAPPTPDPCVAAPSGLISWWPGECDAGDAANGNDGTLQNEATLANGYMNRAFLFDGTNDYVSVPHDASLNPTAALTIEAWINADSTAGAGDIVSKWGASGQNQYIFKIHNNSDKLRIELSENGSGSMADLQGNTSIPVDTWVHVAVTFDSATETVQLYYNGQPDGSLGVGPGRSINSGTSDLIIGAVSTPSMMEHFDGQIDEVAIYDRALSASEIEAIYDAGSGGKCELTPPAPPVGGLAELPDASDSAGRNYVALAGLAAVGLVALGAGAWYARRRWVR